MWTPCDAWFIIFVPLLLVAGLLVVQGTLGIWLEERADHVTVHAVGGSPMVGALHELVALNPQARRRGFLWPLLSQHPGMDERVPRLVGGNHHPEPPEVSWCRPIKRDAGLPS